MGKHGEKLGKVGKSSEKWEKVGKSDEKWGEMGKNGEKFGKSGERWGSVFLFFEQNGRRRPFWMSENNF